MVTYQTSNEEREISPEEVKDIMDEYLHEAHENRKLIIEERRRENLVPYENYTISIGDCEYSFGLYY